MQALFDLATPNAAGHRDVTPQQVYADQGGHEGKGVTRAVTRIIDVREPQEFTGELGHIAGAELVPLATIAAALAPWDRQRAVVLICRSGRRSEQAANALVAAGFARVMNMVGGMLAWNAAGLPIAGASH